MLWERKEDWDFDDGALSLVSPFSSGGYYTESAIPCGRCEYLWDGLTPI